MRKQSYKEQERQRREDEIIRVAGKMLGERGYANLNMDDLAEVVGISKPTLYQHFKGKEELICQVIAHNMESFSQFTAEESEGSPLERLVTMMRTMTKGRYKSTHLWGAMNSDTVWKVFRDNPVLIEQRQRFNERMQAIVDEAKEAGEISKALPTPLIVRIMFGMQMAVGDPHRPPEESMSSEEIDKALDDIVTIFLHGISST